jgi:hypothetical protein
VIAEWDECPSRGMSPTMLPGWLARCPFCGWEFTTLMTYPRLPRHWRNAAGDVQIRPESP